MEVEALLLPLAVWRLYRLLALDTGPKCILRRIRCRLGVCYKPKPSGGFDYNNWTTKDGSLAEMLCCSKCAPIWWATGLVALMLLAPTIYLPLTLVLNAAAAATILEAAYSRIDKEAS